MEIGRDKLRKLVILSIAIAMCLSVISFPLLPAADSVVMKNIDNDFLKTPIIPYERIGSNSGTGSLGSSTAIINGANYLIHAQADVTEDNAGNGPQGSETPEDPDDGGWDWVSTIFTHSTSASPVNIYGATAQGLYYAYRATQLNSITPDPRYMIAMTDAANKMVANANIRSAADLIYLMLFDNLPSVCGTTYQDAAKAKYDARISTYGSAQALAEYIRDVRGISHGYPNGIIAWDIGAWVKVAAMLDERYPGLGYDLDADAMAEVIYQDSFNDSPGYFDIIDDQGFDPTYSDVNYWWYTLGITGLIDAFDAAQVHLAEIPGLLTILSACQYPSGAYSFSYGANLNDEDWQSTAYAVMTLGNLNAYTYRNEIGLAVSWLESTQDPVSGGWVYSSGNHYPEVSGENLAALYFDGPIYNTDTGEVFWSIMAAQDDADTLDGHTILVEPGTYKGTVIVYKELIIQSETPCSAIIDANQIDVCNYRNSYCKGISYSWAQSYDPGLLKNGFLVFVDNVIIDGFSIINALWPSQYNRGIGVIIGTISTTYVSWCPWNVDQWGGTVPNPTQPHPTGVIIRNNCIDGASDGIYNWASNGNTFEYNTITNTVALGGIGIQCYEGGTDNIIHGNTMSNIAGAGISICGAWPNLLLDCSNTLVYDNTVTNSNWGIQFYNMGGSGVQAYHNDLLNNNRGIVVEGVGDATVGIAYENNIEGNSQYGVINSCPTGIFNAGCNWWGHITGPGPIASGSGDPVSINVKYCPWLDDEYPDGDCLGGAICWNTRTGIYYCCIQCAIDDPLTINGDTIEVFALTQIEQINIYKSITLMGQGIGSTILMSPAFPAITVTANNVNIRDLTLTDSTQLVEGIRIVTPASTGLTVERVAITNLGAGTGANAYGIYVQTSFSNLKVLDCEFNSVAHTTYYRTIGVFAPNNLNLNNFEVSDSTFTTIWTGIYLRSEINGLDVFNNIFQNQQLTDTGGCAAGVYIGDGSDYNFDIQNIEIADNTFTNFIRGVYVWNYANDAIIGSFNVHDNTFTDSLWSSPMRFILGLNGDEDVGITGPLTIDGNTFTQTAELTPGAAVATIDFRSYCEHPTCNIAVTDNEITFSGTYTHAKYGIKFSAYADAFFNVLIEDNIINGNNVLDGKTGTIPSSAIMIDHYSSSEWPTDVFGIDILHNSLIGFDNGFCIYDNDNSQYGGFPTNNDVHINYNNINDNTNGIINDNPGMIDAECNWYGVNYVGPTHPSNPFGTGDSVSDYVDFEPWLTLPFEDPNTVCGGVICSDPVYVDDSYTTSTPGYGIDHFPLLQWALDRVCPGGTVYIYPGNYGEGIPYYDAWVDGISIIGMNIPLSFDMDSANAAIITLPLHITGDGITVNYLVFNPSITGAVVVSGDNIVIQYNKFLRGCLSNPIGIENLGQTILDARNNWWGRPDGPSGNTVDLNTGRIADGLGVKIVDNGPVLFDPWAGVDAVATASQTSVETGKAVLFNSINSFAYHLVDGQNDFTVLWDFDDGYYSMDPQIGHTYASPGTYHASLRIQATDPELWGEFMYDWYYLTITVVNPGAPLSANADGSSLGGYETIVDEKIQLYGIASGGTQPYIFYWDYGDGTTGNAQNPVHIYKNAGMYTVTLTVIDDIGSTVSDTTEVNVHEANELVVDIVIDEDTITNLETLFTATISGGIQPYTYSWDFGDGTVSSDPNPTHEYEEPGTYTVTLTVTDSDNHQISDSAEISVNEGESDINTAQIKQLSGGFRITATITAGTLDCDWNIKVTANFMILGGETSGTITANTEETVKLPLTFAFGNAEITVTADDIQKQYTAFALGPLFLNIQEA